MQITRPSLLMEKFKFCPKAALPSRLVLNLEEKLMTI